MIINKFSKQKPISMLTSYDAPMAKIAENAGIDILLVGDSLGPNVLGYDSVHEVTLQDMVHHTKAVRRGAPNTHILSDLPWESVKDNNVDTIIDAAHKLMEAGATSIKLEVEQDKVDFIASLVKSGINLCTHIGYTPQTPNLKVTAQGKEKKRALELIELAKQSEQNGASMLLMELVPLSLSKLITEIVDIPTIGIGAGMYTTGQVQVMYDITGFSPRVFKHAKLYKNIKDEIYSVFKDYRDEVYNGKFPTLDTVSNVSEDFIKEIRKEIENV